jgi:tRNA (guanine37-N1)-methyltransferase
MSGPGIDFACADGLGPVIFFAARPGVEAGPVGELAAGAGAVLLCGRYEAWMSVIEERNLLRSAWRLSCPGRAAATPHRRRGAASPGVMVPETLAEESFEAGLLEYPHYTRPRNEGRKVPEIC